MTDPRRWPTGRPTSTSWTGRYVADPFRIWDELRRTCPVAHTDRRGSTWLPTRYQDVVDLAHDIEHFSSPEITVIPFTGERARRAGAPLRPPAHLGRPAAAHLDPPAPPALVLPPAGRELRAHDPQALRRTGRRLRRRRAGPTPPPTMPSRSRCG